jgi:hypothetical protein
MAFLMISRPICSSSSSSEKFWSLAASLTNAVPHPTTIPSSTAALVALSASSILSFLFFISISVAAHTLITATPPASLASLSASFSLS